MIKLKDLIKPGSTEVALRSTYTDRTEQDIEQTLEAMLAELVDDLDAYIKELPYPKTSVDMYQPVNINRVPDKIRMQLVDRLDEVLDGDELLLKFDMYMILCVAIGNYVSEKYSRRYQAEFEKIKKSHVIPIYRQIKNN